MVVLYTVLMIHLVNIDAKNPQDPWKQNARNH